MSIPIHPKIYHIVHVDRLLSIITDDGLLCDAEVVKRSPVGTNIGMNQIKQRRLKELTLVSHFGLYVGECVPFYFCPRSIMLYLIHQANHPELNYHGGQSSVIHLQADLFATVHWAKCHHKRWAFTLSNAGSRYFEDHADLQHLDKIDWQAVEAKDWQQCKEGKQAEFLLEYYFPWHLIELIGIYDNETLQQVSNILEFCKHKHRPSLQVKTDWYY